LARVAVTVHFTPISNYELQTRTHPFWDEKTGRFPFGEELVGFHSASKTNMTLPLLIGEHQ
jgi:hypothetical protein